MQQSDSAHATTLSRTHLLLFGLFAALMLVPTTLPVPVLRGLVQDRFDVTELATSAFMSINMVGAFLAAPVAGLVADRFGRHKLPIVAALLVDAACFFTLTTDIPFSIFMGVRFLEGCAHIFALSLLLSLAAVQTNDLNRGRTMGIVGAGIMFGVAIGAPLGGVLGREYGELFPVQVGSVLLLGTAALFLLTARDATPTRARPGLRHIFRLARSDRRLLAPLAFAFIDRFTVGFFTSTFPLFMKRVYDLPVDHVGMLLGLLLGPFCLLSYPFGKLAERYSRVKLMAGGSLLYGGALCTLGAWSPSTLPILMVTLGVLSAVMFVPSLLLITELATPTVRSTALGAFNSAGSLGFIVGPLTGGFVSQSVASWSDWSTGYTSAFAVAGFSEIACVLLTLPFLIRLTRDKHRPS